MTNLVKADLYRSVKHIAVYAAVGLMLLMLGVGIYMISPGNVGFSDDFFAGFSDGFSDTVASDDTSTDDTEMTTEEFNNMSFSEQREFMKSQDGYKLDKDIQSDNINLYYIFIFIPAVVIAVDFNSGCAKNTLTSAISRRKYFISKVLTVTLMCLVLYFAHTYIMYYANIIFNGNNLASDLREVTKIALIQLPAVFMIIMIPTGIAFMVKKTAVYNLVTIPLVVVLQLLFKIGSILFHIPEKVMNYTPESMFITLANNPDKEYLVISYLVCAAVCALILAAGYLTFRKSEIK